MKEDSAMPTPADAAGFQAAASSRHSTSAEEDVFYPSSDGKPMAENMWQGEAIMATAGDLKLARPDALVAADILVYPERGNARWSRAPDVLVALGIGTHKRMSYLVWREGKPPDWVLEVASPSTKEKDLGEKRDDYAAMGVPEYWLFDPKGGQFPRGMPRLQGLALVGGLYRPIPQRVERGMAMIRSNVLALDVRREGELLRFRDPATGEDIRHHAESESIAKAAQLRDQEAARAGREAARAEREAARADRAAARVRELEAALERVRASGRGDAH